MRRLPIYFILDCSESMVGEPMEAINTGFQSMLSVMRRNPQVCETAWISVIAFADDAQQIIPLTEVSEIGEVYRFYQTKFISTDSQANLGKALKKVAECADREVVKLTLELDHKGDWKPLVFIMTAGLLSDIKQFESGLQTFKAKKWGSVTVFAVGTYANEAVLRQISENIIKLNSMTGTDAESLFRWCSQSIPTATPAFTGDDCWELPPPPSSITFI